MAEAKWLESGALALYRGKAARVIRGGERIEIDLGRETLRVREKDLDLLHPGPLNSLSELTPLPGEMRAAWEILAGSETSLAELSELAFGRFTPAAAWAAWQFVVDGLYFTGSPERIRALSEAEVAAIQRARDAQAGEERSWSDFLERARKGERAAENARYLKELEPLAYGATVRSRVLRELGRAETPESAHALLLEQGMWDERNNPHPRRSGLPLAPPDLPVPALPDEPRRDLTHLAAFAIDDEGNETPDDAVSLDGERIWVHVADVSALVKPDSALDQEARARAETLHLPEMHIHLFPQAVTAALGLGLQPVSPAFSFGIDLAPDGSIQAVEVTPSWVRVERVSYAQANQRMAEPALAGLERMADLRRAYRLSHGAIDIDLPEVRVHVDEAGEVFIDPILTLRSRRVVEESMILAGEAAARFAVEHRIPSLYSNQDAPDEVVPHDSLAGMFAMRRFLRRSQVRVQPGPHAGLGLAGYSQATSPLRRALDLTVHQQLRAWLKSEPLQDESRLVERIGMVDAVVPALRKAERDSEKHWTLVYLLRKPGWQGKAVLVNRFGGQATILVPELALEAKLALPAALGLDEELQVACTGIDLPQLEFSLKLSA